MNDFEYCLETLTKFLAGERIDYVLIGGIAVSFYGEPRLTQDIDVIIDLEKKKLPCLLNKAEKKGLKVIPENVEKFVKDTGVVPLELKESGRAGKVDLVLKENIWEELALSRAKMKKIGSIKVKLISPEDLILHKIMGRPRDLEDVKGIVIRQKDQLDRRYIESWLKKIGKPELLDIFRKLYY